MKGILFHFRYYYFFVSSQNKRSVKHDTATAAREINFTNDIRRRGVLFARPSHIVHIVICIIRVVNALQRGV